MVPSVFLYRGGSSGEGDDVIGVEGPTDNTDRRVEEDNIRVTPALASASDPTAKAAAEAVESPSASSRASPPRKKLNAVGDPDGNSSEDESASDDDDLDELDELEKDFFLLELERQRKLKATEGGDGMEEGAAGFETIVEMAARTRGMKERITEMEGELERRRGEAAEEGETDLDADGEEGEEEEEEDSVSTSYHMAGTDVAKEDELLKRQRKYKRGSIFKDSPKRRKSGPGDDDSSSASTTETARAVPTTIDSDALDDMLVSAFRSMVFLPPPSPRLPSPAGSASLRNVDVAARRRPDRRTLYHGLLAELGGSHEKKENEGKKGESASRRRYLDAGARQAISDLEEAGEGSLHNARTKMFQRMVSILANYLLHTTAMSSPAGHLILPETLQLLPLFCLSLRKSRMFRNSTLARSSDLSPPRGVNHL